MRVHYCIERTQSTNGLLQEQSVKKIEIINKSFFYMFNIIFILEKNVEDFDVDYSSGCSSER